MEWRIVLCAVFCLMSMGIVLYALWIGAISLIGAGLPEIRYADAAPLRIAVMICARNEEMVIVPLIRSLKKQDYPRECYRIFVIAHNCRDHTAELAASEGAEVFIRNAPEEKCKVQALQYGLDCVHGKYGDFFSHYAVFDADCLVHRDFLREISAALAMGADAASGYYSSKNFEDSLISRLSGTLYAAIMHGTCIPQGKLGLPVNVYGSGYAAKMIHGTDLDQIRTQVDDFEFSTRLVMKGARLVSAPKAVIYAEMPVKLQDALIQRRRWAAGDNQCFRRYERGMRRLLPVLGWKGIKQYMDLIMNPAAVCTFFGLIPGGILLRSIGQLKAGLFLMLTAMILYCCVFWYNAVFALKQEGRSVRENIPVVLLFPLWILITPLFAVETLFRRSVEWKETRRISGKSIEDMEVQGKE